MWIRLLFHMLRSKINSTYEIIFIKPIPFYMESDVEY